MAEEQEHPPRRSFMSDHPIRSADKVKYLTNSEIDRFLDDLDHNDDGYITYNEVEQKLDHAHDELAPQPGTRSHHLSKRDSDDDRARHAFLRGIMGGSGCQRIPRDEFASLVREWKIPSLEQSKKQEEDEKRYFRRLPGWRRVRAYWAARGPEVVFVGLVVSMQLAFGVWQLVKYQTTPQYRAAFGWGVVMAKTCAGALYPTFFFLILSMSRYFATWLRRSYYLSRFFNWDLSQEFHIRISCVAILLATLHAIGHLTGSFVHGSDPENEEQVAAVLGPDAVPRPYVEYVRSLPGWTGITTLGMLYILSILSTPPVRRRNYEVFQIGHLLMFPIIGLMMAHGTSHLFQWPMFGYFLAFPTLLVVVERVTRVLVGFHRIKATIKILDRETVEIAATMPRKRPWVYRAGQYIFLQVPSISLFQWHPFTVSFCRDNHLMVHIKTDGNWTGKLRQMASESGESEIEIGLDGPFGAPAQRFYDFSHSVIIGAGIGVTPFSGILSDLQHKDDMGHGGPASRQLKRRRESSATAAATSDQNPLEGQTEKRADNNDNTTTTATTTAATTNQGSGGLLAAPLANNESKPEAQDFHPTTSASAAAADFRRVDFHWMVRDRNYLLWLSDLLNDVFVSQAWHREHEEQPHLDIRINTHVTATRKDIVTHVYRWLLEMHRTDEHPASPLTGLLNPTHFGRPDFEKILDEHYEDVRRFRACQRQGQRQQQGHSDVADVVNGSSDANENSAYYKEEEVFKVGVFYCGVPAVGEILADKCSQLTTRGRKDGSRIEYHFMVEVFN
jgi:dual oxidase